MFGYVVPEKPELKIKEYETYRGFYCGVCKSIGKRLGQLPRVTLTYDAAFLAILISSAAERNAVFRREQCIVHPLKKKHIAVSNEVIDYASDINVILAYYNMVDDWRDEKSLKAGAAKLLLTRAFNKIRGRYAAKCNIIDEKLVELSKLEAEGCSSVDKAAEPFARLMEEVFDYPGLADESGKVLRWLGYNLGRWIYILDAYDDIEKDIKKCCYNPFVKQFGFNGENIDEFKARIKDRAEFSLTYTLTEMTKAFELLGLKSYKGIIDNILYMGMLRKTENILRTGSCDKVEKSI